MLNLKQRRLELGLTMLDVAKIVGVSEATICRYESGNIRNMRQNRIKLYAQALQVPPSAFIDDDAEQKESTPTDSNGRSAIVEKINSLSDSQLDKLSGYLDALIDK